MVTILNLLVALVVVQVVTMQSLCKVVTAESHQVVTVQCGDCWNKILLCTFNAKGTLLSLIQTHRKYLKFNTIDDKKHIFLAEDRHCLCILCSLPLQINMTHSIKAQQMVCIHRCTMTMHPSIL